MIEDSHRFYLLHTERKFISALFQRRHRDFPVSWGLCLHWLEGDTQRLQRLLDQGLILRQGQRVQLSASVIQLLEEWEHTPSSQSDGQIDWMLLELQQLAQSFKVAHSAGTKLHLLQDIQAILAQAVQKFAYLRLTRDQNQAWKHFLNSVPFLNPAMNPALARLSLSIQEILLKAEEKSTPKRQKAGPFIQKLQQIIDLKAKNRLKGSTNLIQLLESDHALHWQPFKPDLKWVSQHELRPVSKPATYNSTPISEKRE